ncbi:MAG: fibronectin type III domain-containing protein, partial [Clostridia bacterium]|nr:fibronectin type III domain-containing protein [Clostridia bacterium]
SFARWNNTTDTTYIDGVDAAHKVYAGTRYQYGVKAYFARRLDPIANVEIGGNVNEPSGNFNLGMVGPLKTTVRITTRTLNTVTGGSKQLTVKWAGSSIFTGYEVQVATDAAFTKNVKTVKIANAKTYQTNVTGLKAKTTYYVRVRSYHEFEGMTYYGGWSNVKSAKTK